MIDILTRLLLACVVAFGAGLIGYSLHYLGIGTKQATPEPQPVSEYPQVHPTEWSAPREPARTPQRSTRAEKVHDELIPILIRAHDLSATPDAGAHLRGLLGELGVQEIAPRRDTRFDPDQHEEVETRPAQYSGGDRLVLGTHRRGWRSDRQILRPAEVIVTASAADSAERSTPWS